MNFPGIEDIVSAANRIAPFIHRTPVLSSESINGILESSIYFKCENFQKVGAFKYRGATNAVQQLSVKQLKFGVATHSSGNHAQALALAAKIKRVPAYIVMPSNAPKSKRNAVIGYGATVIDCDPTLEAREIALNEILEKKKAHFIHPYNDYRIIEGQATVVKELIEDTSNLDYVIAPVGGGGLLSGSALSVKYFSPAIKIVGAEPTGANDAHRSLNEGRIIPSINPDTIADGLLTSLGSKTFPIIHEHVEQILTVEDSIIIEAMKLIWQRMKIIVEPSAAVPLAVVMKNQHIFTGKNVGLIISGGNVDFDTLPFS
jgi:threonine dehydratase